ncbi:unnamed protein product [Symbiodinium natans]|uniref:Reverse transcriptase domain-containing protein n=1 Tax=Symbiodinium natans TaxID=878477 RepID=A0A812QHM7_9DINO|nr:unnamed protein product [Symbiodinium natans]
MFVFPRAKFAQGTKTILKVSCEHAWKCQKCQAVVRSTPFVKRHSKGPCPETRPAFAQRQIRRLRDIRQWLQTQKNHQCMRAIDKPLFATFTFFLTANLNKTGITKNPLAAELAREAQASFISLQEIDVNYLSAPGFVEAWRHEGYSALLSAGDVNKGSHRVALVSKVPLRQVNLGLARAQPRHVAGLVELCSGSRKHHLLVIAAYGFPGDLEATSEMLRELVEAARAFGGSFVIFGDFNATADEGYIVEATASGVVKVLDADFEEALPFTNPYRADLNTGEKRRTRRIDYAIADRSTLASRVEHFERPELSDHLCVGYDLEVECRRSDYVLPKFHELSLQDEAAIGLNFDAVWDEELFSTYLDADQLDEAWTQLSDVAECSLGADFFGWADRSRRSSFWEPVRPRRAEHRCGEHGHESRATQLLRGLLGRLSQLRQQPHDEHLQRAIRRGCGQLRRVVPGFPYIDLCYIDASIDAVSELYNVYSEQERNARLERWRVDTQQQWAKAHTWVKRKAEEALKLQGPTVSPDAIPTCVHPASMVAEHAELWHKKWTSSSTSNDASAVRGILASLQQFPLSDLKFDLSPEDLIRATKKMKGKSPGADQWTPEQLLALPKAWWAAVARLWCRVVACSYVPVAWRRAVVALLPKRDEATRPIALCSVIWRAGARCMNAQLRGWVDTWLNHLALGAAPQRGVQDGHARILQAWHMGCRRYVKQDLSAYFDSLNIEAVELVLARLGAPQWLAGLLRSFYTEPQRLFKAGGCFDARWRTTTAGFLQGCPLSPVIALAVGATWAEYCRCSDVDLMIFVDDRALWPLPHAACPATALRAALQRSDRFDEAFKFVCKPTKCAIVVLDSDSSLNELIAERGYSRESSLELLGIELKLSDGATSLLKLSLQTLLLRLRYLRLLRPRMEYRRRILTSLIHSALFWAAGVARPSARETQQLQAEITATLKDCITEETPQVLVYAVFGWQFSVEWYGDWAALKTAWRFQTRPPAWLDTVSLQDTFVPWIRVAPAALAVLDRMGWSASANGKVLHRTDPRGDTRRFFFGYDNLGVLKHWLKEEHQRRGVHRCGRVKRSLHRAEPECARGLALPGPPHGQHHALAGHRLLGRQGPVELRRAAMATGGSAWHTAAKLRRPRDVPVQCLCGGLWPSRAHLAWACEKTAVCRHEVPLPRERAQERLFAAQIEAYPPAPPAVDLEGFEQDVADHLEAFFKDDAELFLASDGSAKEGVGAFAIVTAEASFGTGDASEDQSAFRNEALALLYITRALQRLPGDRRGRVHVLCDCQAALQGVARPGMSALPCIFEEIATNLRNLQSRGIAVSLTWVPAHGRKRHWRPPDGISAELCRDLNDKADAAANCARENRAAHSRRALWHQAFEEATAWETQAIQAAAAAGLLLAAAVERQPVPATEPEGSLD